MCIGSRAPNGRTVLQNWQDKPLKHLPRSSLSWNTCQDFLKIPAALESCSGNRAEMLLKSYLGIKCHSQYNKVCILNALYLSSFLLLMMGISQNILIKYDSYCSPCFKISHYRKHKRSNKCQAFNFHHRFFFFEMLVTMSSIRINNN